MRGGGTLWCRGNELVEHLIKEIKKFEAISQKKFFPIQYPILKYLYKDNARKMEASYGLR